MRFAEKLDFLMNITNTTNSSLAQNVKLDPSHISRLRRGQRRALKDSTSIAAMAAYFARHCGEDYRRKAVCDMINIGQATLDESILANRIARWLTENRAENAMTVESFLADLSETPTRTPAARSVPGNDQRDSVTASTSIFWGIEGKRRAVVGFLSAVLARSEPVTMLLFSDEPTDWMTADRTFALEWASLMTQVLAKGGRIVIIHTVSRDLDEMLHAVSQWMPLYMSGAIEPYFYPKKRDGVFRRTLFVACGIAAVVSSSVVSPDEQSATFLFRDAISTKAHEAEFTRYLKLCRPLMRIFTYRDQAAYFDTLIEFEKEKSDVLICTESLSLLTMPESVLSCVASRLHLKEKATTEKRLVRMRLFEELLKTNRFLEIVRLPEIGAVLEGKVRIALSVLLGGETAYYTAGEFLAHLENLVGLMRDYDRFDVCLTRTSPDDRYTVYAKEDIGVLVAKTSPPPVVLAMREGNMNAAFWDFLKSRIGEKPNPAADKAKTIENLETYIQGLKAAVFSGKRDTKNL